VTVVVGPGTVVVTVWSVAVAVAVAQTESVSPPTVATPAPSTPTVWDGAVVVAHWVAGAGRDRCDSDGRADTERGNEGSR
jgi:hypothetical protein